MAQPFVSGLGVSGLLFTPPSCHRVQGGPWADMGTLLRWGRAVVPLAGWGFMFTNKEATKCLVVQGPGESIFYYLSNGNKLWSGCVP